jgi:hypothetical protein
MFHSFLLTSQADPGLFIRPVKYYGVCVYQPRCGFPIASTRFREFAQGSRCGLHSEQCLLSVCTAAWRLVCVCECGDDGSQMEPALLHFSVQLRAGSLFSVQPQAECLLLLLLQLLLNSSAGIIRELLEALQTAHKPSDCSERFGRASSAMDAPAVS